MYSYVALCGNESDNHGLYQPTAAAAADEDEDMEWLRCCVSAILTRFQYSAD